MAGGEGFVGGTADPSGLTHLGAREYNPSIGRFVSADPVMDLSDPQQINGYSYACGDIGVRRSDGLQSRRAMAVRDSLDRFGRYRDLLDLLAGVPSVVSSVEPRVVEDGPVRAISYLGFPEPGYITGFTYGLSLFGHPDWGQRGRELSITVRSDDFEWSQVPARVVAALRGICPFDLRQVLGYMEPYVASSSMSSIVLAKSAVEPDSGVLDLGLEVDRGRGVDLVEIVGTYPIYSSERDFVQACGFDDLWGLDWDRFDPARLPVV